MMPKRNIAAFTLVELLMVIAIVSVMIGMVVSEFGATEATTADQALKIVSAQLDYVRELAVSNNSFYTVTFDKAKNRMELTHSGTDTNLDQLPEASFWQELDASQNRYFVFADLPMSLPVTLKGAVESSNDAVEVTATEFGPDGGTTATDDTEVWIAVGNTAPTYGSTTVLAGTGLLEIGDLASELPMGLSNEELLPPLKAP